MPEKKTPKRTPLTSAQLSAAENLRRLVARKIADGRLSKTDLAESAGMSPSLFSQYANSKTALNVEAVLRLARSLECHPAEIDPTIMDILPTHGDAELERHKIEAAFRLAFTILIMPDKQRAALNGIVNSMSGVTARLPLE